MIKRIKLILILFCYSFVAINNIKEHFKSHDPKEIPLLIKKLSSNDFVTGSRYIKGGKSDYVGYRNIISRFANKLCRILLNMPFY